jgi:hypothetical protein
MVPPCWRRFITSLHKSRLHQNPIFCPIFLLFFLFVCFFSFCLLTGLRTAQKEGRFQFGDKFMPSGPQDGVDFLLNQLTKCRLSSLQKGFIRFFKGCFSSLYNQNYYNAVMNIYCFLSSPSSPVAVSHSAQF